MMGMLFKFKTQKLLVHRGHKVFVEELAQIFVAGWGIISRGFKRLWEGAFPGGWGSFGYEIQRGGM